MALVGALQGNRSSDVCAFFDQVLVFVRLVNGLNGLSHIYKRLLKLLSANKLDFLNVSDFLLITWLWFHYFLHNDFNTHKRHTNSISNLLFREI